jgi:Flp pilus assembly protein TadG
MLVEFSIIAPIIIGLLLGAIQVSLIFFANSELERVTQAAGRMALIGQAQSMTAAQFQAAACGNLAALFSCSRLMISLKPQTSCSTIATTPPTLTYDAHGNVTNSFPYNAGTFGDIMVLQVMYDFPVIGGPLFNFVSQSNGSHLLTSTAVFVNEPQ